MSALTIHDPTGTGLVTSHDGVELVLLHTGEPPALMRARITDLVQWMLDLPGEKLEMDVKHSFCDGMYIRELLIPKGAILAGKIHRLDCINFVKSGDITVLTEFGLRRVGAGFMGSSPAGIQKIGHAHEDTVFVNVFRTDETDITVIEELIASKEHAPVELALQGD